MLLGDGSAFDGRVGELREAGFYVQDYPGSFEEARADRVGVVFSESSWLEFKQQVAVVEENVGFVTVWTHRDEGVLWVAAYEDQYYYCVVG